MEAILVSTLAVAVGEMGDKTQLLALLLAARFRRPWPIAAGILGATVLNHGLAGLVGGWVASLIGPETLRLVLGASFLVIALWTLRPDSIGDGEGDALSGYGVLLTTFIAFFIAEMGDKTQVATVALAARFDNLPAVVAGTTLGMLIADLPPIWLAGRGTLQLPLAAIRYAAAIVFALIGLAALAGWS